MARKYKREFAPEVRIDWSLFVLLSIADMLSSFLLAVALLQRVQCHQPPIAIPPLPEDSNPVPNDLQSFSLEFCFFPDYAGNKTHPNTFSKNLLSNLERITGVPPAVRVGGTTQYDHRLPTQHSH